MLPPIHSAILKPGRITDWLAARRRMRSADLQDWIKLACLSAIGLGFVVWWQITSVL